MKKNPSSHTLLEVKELEVKRIRSKPPFFRFFFPEDGCLSVSDKPFLDVSFQKGNGLPPQHGRHLIYWTVLVFQGMEYISPATRCLSGHTQVI